MVAIGLLLYPPCFNKYTAAYCCMNCTRMNKELLTVWGHQPKIFVPCQQSLSSRGVGLTRTEAIKIVVLVDNCDQANKLIR